MTDEPGPNLMNDDREFDQTLIEAYRQQSAPANMRRNLLEQFEGSSRHSHDFLRYAALAVVVICVVIAVFQLKLEVESSKSLPPSLSISLSTAAFHPLPTLSSIKLGTKPERISLLSTNTKILTGTFRKTLNLTNDIL